MNDEGKALRNHMWHLKPSECNLNVHVDADRMKISVRHFLLALFVSKLIVDFRNRFRQ